MKLLPTFVKKLCNLLVSFMEKWLSSPRFEPMIIVHFHSHIPEKRTYKLKTMYSIQTIDLKLSVIRLKKNRIQT